MKMCCLEEVGCEFSGVGCDGRFRREDQEEHTRQNSQKHLTLTASLAVDQDKKHKETEEKFKKFEEQNRMLEMKLQNQEEKHKIEEQKLKQKLEREVKKLENKDREHEEEWKRLKQIIEEQKKDMQELRQMLVLQERKLEEETQKLLKEEQKLKIELQNQCEKFKEQIKKLEEEHQHFHEKTNLKMQKLESNSEEQARQSEAKSLALGLGHAFIMKDFSRVRETHRGWKSPDMYTHLGGYKFCVGVDILSLFEYEHHINVYVYARPGLLPRTRSASGVK